MRTRSILISAGVFQLLWPGFQLAVLYITYVAWYDYALIDFRTSYQSPVLFFAFAGLSFVAAFGFFAAARMNGRWRTWVLVAASFGVVNLVYLIATERILLFLLLSGLFSAIPVALGLIALRVATPESSSVASPALAPTRPTNANHGQVQEAPPQSHEGAGWFPDPSGQPQQRYWDGSNWTNETKPYAPPKA